MGKTGSNNNETARLAMNMFFQKQQLQTIHVKSLFFCLFWNVFMDEWTANEANSRYCFIKSFSSHLLLHSLLLIPPPFHTCFRLFFVSFLSPSLSPSYFSPLTGRDSSGWLGERERERGRKVLNWLLENIIRVNDKHWQFEECWTPHDTNCEEGIHGR